MASIDEIGAQLEKQMQDAATKIDEFVAQQNLSLAKAGQDHEQLMRDLELKIQRLASDETTILSKASAAQHVLAAEQRSLDERQADAHRLEQQAKSMPVELDAARAAEAAGASQLEHQKQEFDKRDTEAKYQLNELTRGISFYRRLGLDFEKISDDKLRLVFTEIDPADPRRTFCFNVRISDSDVYEVDGCEPALSGLEALTKELNDGNDFSRFVQKLRAMFQAAAMQP